jgi:predicted  nucleic acid-binding Zn-ribbon protein
MPPTPVPTTLTIDNVEHQVSAFSATVQRLVEINTGWRDELAAARLEVAKLEAALRQLESELTQTVLRELKEKQAPASEPVEKPEDSAQVP